MHGMHDNLICEKNAYYYYLSTNDQLNTMPKTNRSSYTAAEKIIIINYAKTHGVRSAGRHFTIDNSMISRWIKDASKFHHAAKKCRRVGSGAPAAYPAAEEALVKWVLEFRQNGLAVTMSMIKHQMKFLLANDFVETYPDAKDKFLASESWFYRFLHRHKLALRRKMKIGQQLPQKLNEKIIDFQHFVIKQRRQYKYNLNEIGNMDETPIYFDMVGSTTIETKGAKTVQIRTTGNEKNRFTCVLTVLANGSKLPPLVIFKGKRTPKNLPKEILVLMHPKGWMDEVGMQQWFEKIWRKRPMGREN